MNLQQKCKLHLPNAKIYSSSFAENSDGQALLLSLEGRDFLAVSGNLCGQFTGKHITREKENDALLCPLTHDNRLALNRNFPYTVPRALGKSCGTFGFGDRLGYANPMQLQSLESTSFLPVLAQQSMRELSLMGRKYEQVIDVASWAVFRQGWHHGYGADGDHLKTLQEVQIALDAGCSMITLDCSLALNQQEGENNHNTYEKEDYIANDVVQALKLQFDEPSLKQLQEIYGGAIRFACEVFWQTISPSEREIDFELSVDETENPTSLEAHYFIANELRRRNVELTSLAPRFVGEFEKAVDYKGNLKDFQEQLAGHAKIANHFGHKLSLHSASEKFSIFPIVAQATKGRCHVKTSGTSWLEAVECIAKADSTLFRDMFYIALNHLEEALGHYDVSCRRESLPDIELIADEDLPKLLEMNQEDTRQLMHITYGFILADQRLKERIEMFIHNHRQLYDDEALDLYKRHLNSLYYPNI